MSENQLQKIHGIFKKEKMKIRPSEIKLPDHFKITWETVGGPSPTKVYVPNADFMENIEKYQENRFLNIGRWGAMLDRIPTPTSGKYPAFLWLFKEIMEVREQTTLEIFQNLKYLLEIFQEVREQLVFHDHLVVAVRDWKNQLIAELKTDKNVIFIGVHDRE